ncbi:MAG: hypothetical protein Kow00124_05200 [Anaerolineae bacterium]
MNTQRWIALGMVALIALCVATSSIWVSLLPFGDGEEQAASTPGTPQAEAPVSGEEPEGELTPTPQGLASIEQIVAGQATIAQGEEAAEEVDPLVADLLETLGQESLGVGEEPFVTHAGDFVTLDTMRRAEGTASVYRIGESRLVLRLDPFSVSSGPDLHVLLSQKEEPRTSADALLPTYLDLGPLERITGAQNYEIPADTSFTQYKSVVIYSMSLNIIYSTATLEEVRGG